MAWSREFAEPIMLSNGLKLTTLSEAANYIIGLPPEIAGLPHWLLAMEALSQVTEKSPTTQARLAFLQALKSTAQE